MSWQLELSDPYVREMADRNHTPREMWSMGGSLIDVTCEQCGQGWPCATRRALDELKRSARSALPEVPERRTDA
ncbi:hypothetical protein Drose_04325 [Dactylosporangium roseum]|uniref:Uncharacterized protein n=1 Tax=Dactylosporangium roseum TaxID=47989 RepID=A0ABY5Z7F6_9ACTN|nr:hypothetical protein [Dactylosporangium roseum]UWZ37516.1 hypothetical protein Drose_04325 [Dactylosporangium roseum]